MLNQAGAQNTDPNARIRLNPNAKITIDELGNIYQNDQLVTRIGVVDFDDYNYISKYGENLYDLVDGGLRYDLTVPLARYYSNHANELPSPF